MSWHMSYQVCWEIPEQVLCLELIGDLSLEDFVEVNRLITARLNDDIGDKRIILLVDISRSASMPRAFEQLKASQTYLMRQDLKFILVAGTSKFMRLMMTLTFNLCRPSLMFFEDKTRAMQFAQKTRSVARG
jgi:hypothetical protein